MSFPFAAIEIYTFLPAAVHFRFMPGYLLVQDVFIPLKANQAAKGDDTVYNSVAAVVIMILWMMMT